MRHDLPLINVKATKSDPSDPPLGPTMKLRRPVVQKMYHSEIESFYKD